jgi:hypothetical protein
MPEIARPSCRLLVVRRILAVGDSAAWLAGGLCQQRRVVIDVIAFRPPAHGGPRQSANDEDRVAWSKRKPLRHDGVVGKGARLRDRRTKGHIKVDDAAEVIAAVQSWSSQALVASGPRGEWMQSAARFSGARPGRWSRRVWRSGCEKICSLAAPHGHGQGTLA